MSYWLQNMWYCCAYKDDLPAGGVLARTVCNECLVLWRGRDEIVHALEDRCAHRYAPLSMGDQVHTDRIRCKYHGLEFNSEGICVRNPHGAGMIPKSAALRSFPTHEYAGLIWVWLGWEAPDTSLLPDLSVFLPDSSFQQGGRGSLTMGVPYELVVDNVMDLSHAALLHDGLLGNDQSIKAQTESGKNGRKIFAKRWMPGIDPPEYLDLIYKGDGKPIDMWHDVEWQAGANLLLDVGATSPGLTKEQGTGVYAQHIVTPISDASCTYFFMSARRNPPKRHAEEDAKIQARLLEIRKIAFAEQDAPIIRGQYEAILRKGSYRPYALPGIDAAAVMWRRSLETMLKDEAGRLGERVAATSPDPA